MRSRSEKRRNQSLEHLTDVSSNSFHRGLLQAFDLLQNLQRYGMALRDIEKKLDYGFYVFFRDDFFLS